MQMENQRGKKFLTATKEKYGGSGNIFNPEPIVTLVDKNKNRYK